MSAIKRNNVVINGNGENVIMFAHGFGCDQNMWRYVYPAFQDNYTTVLFDHVGAGNSDLSAYSFQKYDELEGYAEDIVEIAKELNIKDAVFVGHSVSAIMGLIAANKAPDIFKSLILIGPSPSYINQGDYIGGFSSSEIDELLESMNNNHLGWSMAMAPVIMGNPEREELGKELANSFCKTDPEIAKHFAKTTFLTDKRDILQHTKVPVLILQCSNDIIAPLEVGHYMHKQIKNSKLVVMKATGHCPNLSAPEETIAAIRSFLND
ncbi:alpha/beta fold hydrolase [Chryseobacterium indoltheticum]|uniref:Sigma factor sigB regulation protein rsbQ n=1 Tax=Chryseobacterium indoltheticum TaxID=254 RepID=A0A381FF54_9FLAO|nr:alpha/beta hydrolase [Chryseobacterium indoltheticum]AZA74297.1 alpha/beta hydrolase [Chryseobacterium indoltheticum]SIQ01786.1 sigma-B regulation protein RsbQ [Chryseobacterium indoltheticum]SUX45113.1 Sigma factor sigB regulation protein rsbQ [Chryseobacterium indoltheticum]